MKAWPLLAALCLSGAAPAAAMAQDSEDAAVDAAANAAEAAADAAARIVEEAEPAPPTTVSQSFADCAARFRRTTAPEGSQRRRPFDCTQRYYDGLAPATTHDFAMSGNHAVAIGDLYIDEILQPAIAARLAEDLDNDRWAETRGRLLEAFIHAARNAGTARCAVVYDIWSEGTMRVAVGSNCGIQNRDALIDDLLGIEEHLLPR